MYERWSAFSAMQAAGVYHIDEVESNTSRSCSHGLVHSE